MVGELKQHWVQCPAWEGLAGSGPCPTSSRISAAGSDETSLLRLGSAICGLGKCQHPARGSLEDQGLSEDRVFLFWLPRL